MAITLLKRAVTTAEASTSPRAGGAHPVQVDVGVHPIQADIGAVLVDVGDLTAAGVAIKSPAGEADGAIKTRIQIGVKRLRPSKLLPEVCSGEWRIGVSKKIRTLPQLSSDSRIPVFDIPRRARAEY